MIWDSNFDCYRPLNDDIIEKGYWNKEVDFLGYFIGTFRNNNSCGSERPHFIIPDHASAIITNLEAKYPLMIYKKY